MTTHTVEKIGGTSMSNYTAVRNNIIVANRDQSELYNRAFIVSAYAGITNGLLEHKKTGEPGVYALFAEDDNEFGWSEALSKVGQQMLDINRELFDQPILLEQANAFIIERLEGVRNCLTDLARVCSYGHFQLEEHLLTLRELLASLGEAHSASNLALLLQDDGINARFVDLTGWRDGNHVSLDDRVLNAWGNIDVSRELPIFTGYAHCTEGLMKTFDRGYSEMTFSRVAVLSEAAEAIIHKEYHLSSADPTIVEPDKAVPIGRTNYDVADQLANLGMEAIHPRAARGLRQAGIPLRVKNTFEPEHTGTLIMPDYVSDTPCVEIIVGRPHVLALEVFDQEMLGERGYDQEILQVINRYHARVISKDVNANTITHYLDSNLKTVKRITSELGKRFPDADISTRKIAIVSAIGSDMKVPGMLAQTVQALADAGISVLAVHQSMRQVDMQFVVQEGDYETAVRSLHNCLIEPHNHGYAICAA